MSHSMTGLPTKEARGVGKKYIDCLFKTALIVFAHPAKTLILVMIFLLPWEEFKLM